MLWISVCHFMVEGVNARILTLFSTALCSYCQLLNVVPSFQWNSISDLVFHWSSVNDGSFQVTCRKYKKMDSGRKTQRHSIKMGTSALASCFHFFLLFLLSYVGNTSPTTPRLKPNRNGERKSEEVLGISASALPRRSFFQLLFLSLLPCWVAELPLHVCACMELH